MQIYTVTCKINLAGSEVLSVTFEVNVEKHPSQIVMGREAYQIAAELCEMMEFGGQRAIISVSRGSLLANT